MPRSGFIGLKYARFGPLYLSLYVLQSSEKHRIGCPVNENILLNNYISEIFFLRQQAK